MALFIGLYFPVGQPAVVVFFHALIFQKRRFRSCFKAQPDLKHEGEIPYSSFVRASDQRQGEIMFSAEELVMIFLAVSQFFLLVETYLFTELRAITKEIYAYCRLFPF